MLNKLRLERFKNFKDAELILGPLTLLVGTNASGKSNIRDAFRFLHGISRSYKLAEIIGEKYVEGGVLQWRGIRGGTREIAFQGEKTFALEASFTVKKNFSEQGVTYRIEVDLGTDSQAPSLIRERLTIGGQDESFFEAQSTSEQGKKNLIVNVLGSQVTNRPIPFSHQQPIISQLAELATDIPINDKSYVSGISIRGVAKATLQAFSSMRFLDLSPDAMRFPSLPGQTILGDRGENLSSVLQEICSNSALKQALLQWVKELTPMDAMDFEFPADFTGKILLTLIEENGQKTSAFSASDGTLRFLAMIAALLGPEPGQFYFFEELDNGIHPTRLNLLVQLIERKVSDGTIQMVATTHSPQLLRLLSPQSLEYASLTYRLSDRPDAKIKRILDIPEARRVINEQDLARLHESGWLEDAVEFLEEEETTE
ncbi:MAG: AAA family ATPase [Stigonema ocellatum SAG 48.90 = DSM 106950]|nr:AAA family ATPase [Stigonema ocellatum SAG 48.90 = DSM 106950]